MSKNTLSPPSPLIQCILLLVLSSCPPASTQPLNGVLDGIRLILFNRPQGKSPIPEPIRIIGAGLPRTGTGSLHRALTLLGYKVYHMKVVMEDNEHSRQWAALAEGRATPAETIDFLSRTGFNATLDYPALDLFEEQMLMYPDAKVILSVRDDGFAWARSRRIHSKLVVSMERQFSLWFPNPIPLLLPKKSSDLHSIRCALGTGTSLRLDPCDMVFLEKSDRELAELYERHQKYAIATVPQEQLLVYNVKEGWEPLCEFLGKPLPHLPFPHVGDSALLERGLIVFHIIVYSWIPVVLLLIWCCLRFCLVSTTKMREKVKRS